MVASRQAAIPFSRGIGEQRGRRFGTLVQIFERTAVAFLRKYIVSAA